MAHTMKASNLFYLLILLVVPRNASQIQVENRLLLLGPIGQMISGLKKTLNNKLLEECKGMLQAEFQSRLEDL